MKPFLCVKPSPPTDSLAPPSSFWRQVLLVSPGSFLKLFTPVRGLGETSRPLSALLRQRARRLGDAGREKSHPQTLTVGSAGGMGSAGGEPRSAT